MKKILMRAGFSFKEEVNISEILLYNMVGANTGNLLYQKGVLRTIMTADTEITTIKIRRFTDEEIDYFNENYDMFLLPLANALRVPFIGKLQVMTEFIQRLKIPCIVIGIGLQADYHPKTWNYEFDEAANNFFKAVLEKSSSIGVRGEITGEYLKQKGYIPEKDFTVIGCPSLYLFGDNLPEPVKKPLTPESKVSFNFTPYLPQNTYRFIRDEAKKFEDRTFVTQVVNEIKPLYVGAPYEPITSGRKLPADYPTHFSDELMKTGKMIGALDADSWIEYLKTRDFSFGSRIHGNIASVLAGTPCHIIAADSRVKELAQYHNIPFIGHDEIKENLNIFELYEKTDYSCVRKGHMERFSHYLDFLDQNGVNRVSREELNGKETSYDKFINNKKKLDMIVPFSTVSCEEQERRLLEYFSVIEEKTKDKDKKTKQKQRVLEQERTSLEKELKTIKESRVFKMKKKYDKLKSYLRQEVPCGYASVKGMHFRKPSFFRMRRISLIDVSSIYKYRIQHI